MLGDTSARGTEVDSTHAGLTLARQIANTAGHEKHHSHHELPHQRRHYYYRGGVAGRIKVSNIYRKPASSGFFRFGVQESSPAP
jgi:hypothetical protein